MTVKHEGHPTLCHKCQHNGKANNACITCKGASDTPSGKGRTVYSLDSHDDAENIIAQIDEDYLHRLKRTAHPDSVTALPVETENALKRLIAEFAAMPPYAVPILHGLLNGKTFEQIAADLNLSKGCISWRYRQALNLSPWLAAVMRHHGGVAGNQEAWLLKQLAAGVPLIAERIAPRVEAIGGVFPDSHKPYNAHTPRRSDG